MPRNATGRMLDSQILLSGKDGNVIFEMTPDVSEAHSVLYTEKSDIRLPSSFIYYNGTVGRNYQLGAKFLSRTQDEADKTFKYINLLRSWTKPIDSRAMGGVTGYDPEVLRLYGYGLVFRGITCVVVSLNIEYPTDVDYVKAYNGSDMPIIQNVSITLKETHSIEESQNFDIAAFRNGTLWGW